MSLQNGIGDVEILPEVFPSGRILYGLTTLPAELDGPGRVRDVAGGVGRTYLWPLCGDPRGTPEAVVATFRRAGLQCELAPDIEMQIWAKLAVNCGYAAVSAVTGQKVGALLESADARALVDSLIGEVVAVGRAGGLDLDFAAVTLSAQRTAAEGRDHVPSLLADVLAHRRTEVECLNGAVVRLAGKLGMAAPVDEAVYRVIRTIEDGYAHAF